ncbi:hypothetical protein KPL70_014224 [Citrus sinensis]|nr:hypothetical protein KPL70_014224 [Citrus sinensis]
MFCSSSQSYQESFPPLEKQTDPQTKVISQPFVQSPITSSGQPEPPKQYEAVLNWQIQNANAQNQTVHNLGKKIDKVATQVSKTETKVDSISAQNRISKLDTNLRTMINNHIWGPEFNKKEAEIRKLKAELARIDAEREQPSIFTKTESLPIPAPFFDTYQPFYHLSKPPMDYNKFFGLSSLLYRNQEPAQSTPKKPATKVKISEPKPRETSPIPEDSSKATPEPSKKDKALIHQYYYKSVGSQDNNVDISGLLMVQPSTKAEEPSTSTPGVHESDEESENRNQDSSQTEPVPPSSASESSSKPSSTPWFTFNDIPRHKWPARYQEFAAWIDVQMTRPNAQQLQLIQTTPATALTVIHEQFIGEPAAANEAARKEFHQMKCCSLKCNHLEIHYKRMSMLYYKLNGFNDLTLKHVFIASLPPELQRQTTAFNLDIANILLGKIFQLTTLCLDKICEQKDFFKDLIENRQPFASTCKKPYLKIQCKDDKKCTCYTKKKGHFQKHSHKSSSKKFKKPYRYFKKKDPSQFRKKKHNRCFICKKRGHFARNCPNKSAKAIRLIQHLQQSSMLSDQEDVESNFSEQTEQDDQTAFILAESTDDSDIEEIFVISTVQEISQVCSNPTIPLVKISVLPSKFHKPIPVIGFLDTCSQRSILNPSVLPSSCWENHTEFFKSSQCKLSRMLKEQPLPWGPEQTTAVQQLKRISQSPPPLKIPTAGQRILQTDASDEYWSAVLLEKIGETESYCAHASGQFKEAEKNYHVIYKEILAVKYGIKKFEFHLISHNFLIRMDNSSFPKILDFKNKLLPNKQLLNLKAWSAKHDFTVQHIKGPSHSLEILPKAQTCTPGSSSSPQGILVREERHDFTNVLFQDAQDPWEDFQSLLPSEQTQSLPTKPAPQPEPTDNDELNEDYLIYQEVQKAGKQYEKETGDISPSKYPSTP